MRLFRRFGRAMRGALIGLTRAASLRRQSEPPANPASPISRQPRGSAPPKRSRTPRQPRPAPAPRPTRLAWLTRWIIPGRRRPALLSRQASAATDQAPGLSGTTRNPVPSGERPDPFFVRILLIGLAKRIVDNSPPEAKLNIEAVFSVLWRYFLTDQLGQVLSHEAPTAQPGEAPAEQSGAAAPPAALDTQPELQIAGSSVSSPSAGPAAEPHSDLPAKPVRHPGGSLSRRYRNISRYCRTPLGRFCHRPRQPPPPRRLFYAACAGPPWVTAVRPIWRTELARYARGHRMAVPPY